MSMSEGSADSDATPSVDEDGRHARRDRNKYAVVDAYLDLVRAGQPRPSVAEVAERSGVSHRSVFRYFADKDELARTAIERQQVFAQPLLALEVGPDAPFDERLPRFIDRRLQLFEALAPVARLSRSIAHVQPIIASQLSTNRQFFRSQIAHLFSPELDAMDSDDAAAALASLDVVCSFEAVDLLVLDHQLPRSETAAVIEWAMRRILTTS